jgi:hypothetical protein
MYVYRTSWVLPRGFTCPHCKLQMSYLTGSRCWPPCHSATPGGCNKPVGFGHCGEPGQQYPEEVSHGGAGRGPGGPRGRPGQGAAGQEAAGCRSGGVRLNSQQRPVSTAPIQCQVGRAQSQLHPSPAQHHSSPLTDTHPAPPRACAHRGSSGTAPTLPSRPRGWCGACRTAARRRPRLTCSPSSGRDDDKARRPALTSSPSSGRDEARRSAARRCGPGPTRPPRAGRGPQSGSYPVLQPVDPSRPSRRALQPLLPM